MTSKERIDGHLEYDEDMQLLLFSVASTSAKKKLTFQLGDYMDMLEVE